MTLPDPTLPNPSEGLKTGRPVYWVRYLPGADFPTPTVNVPALRPNPRLAHTIYEEVNMATARPSVVPATVGGWLVLLVLLVCVVLIILAFAGTAAALPAWLPYLLIGLVALGIVIG